MNQKTQLQSNLRKGTLQYAQATKGEIRLWTDEDYKQYAQEATFTKRVKDWLDTQEDIAYYKASDRYQKGVSDIIMNVGGVFVLAELKAKNGTESPHQKLFIMEMTRPGGLGRFCYCMADVKELVRAARHVKNNC